MKVLKEYFIAITVSPEFLVLIVGGVCIIFLRSLVQSVSSLIVDSSEILKYFVLLAAGFFVWTSKEAISLLFPGDESEKILQEWEDYWRLKVHFVVSLLYAFVFATLGALVWILGLKVNEPMGFILLVMSVVGGFVVTVTVYFAKISEKEILLKANQ